MPLQSKLDDLCSNVDGTTASFLCGFDGMLIGSTIKIKTNLDIDLFAANFATVIKNTNSGVEKLHDIIATFDSFVVCIRVIEDGFLGIVMGKDGNIGRAKFELTRIGGNIFGA